MSPEDPLVPPIHRAAVSPFDTSQELIDAIADPRRATVYGRYDNPTVVHFEKKVARLEGAARGVAFGSGMAAISTAVVALVPRGGRIVHQAELYGGTVEFFRDLAPRFAGEVVGVSVDDPNDFEAAVRQGADLVYVETPINPTLRLVDLRRVAAAAQAASAVTIVDNTFATPLGQQPIALGIDVSIHSATKFLGGHHDVVAGVLATSDPIAERIWETRKILGGILSPSDAFLLHRGLKTLSLRLEASVRSAQDLARFLETQPHVRRVDYPGLATHPDRNLVARQMSSPGAMLSFELDTDAAGAGAFLDALRVMHRAASLGGVESTVMLPARVSHAGLSDAERARMGISESLVRLSVGTEPLEELQQDLERGFATLDR